MNKNFKPTNLHPYDLDAYFAHTLTWSFHCLYTFKECWEAADKSTEIDDDSRRMLISMYKAQVANIADLLLPFHAAAERFPEIVPHVKWALDVRQQILNDTDGDYFRCSARQSDTCYCASCKDD